MESTDMIPAYSSEEDILASLLANPNPSNCFDLCLSGDFSPSPGACLPEVKLDRELGELEDEGFEDCFEDEDNGLQRDVSLAASTAIPLNSINTSGLDAFFPLEPHSGGEEDVFMATNVSLVDYELFEPDQGVAMEASELPVITSCSDVDSLQDFTPSFCSTPPMLTTTPTPSLPHLSPTSATSFFYPPPLLPLATCDVTPVAVNSTIARQDSELEYLYTLLQNDTSTSESGSFKRDPPLCIPSPHRTPEHSLTDALTTASVSTYSMNGHHVQPHATYFNAKPSPQEQQQVISLSDINSLALVAAGNGSSWNTDFRERTNPERGSQTERHHSPSPSPTYHAPSPASSVNTDYPDSEFCKDLASPDVPNSLNGIKKTEIVDMPFYEFKKLIDCNSISERDKEEVKAIRKRGKNKTAAKNCRQRKLELLSTLQQEIDQLKGKKARLALKVLSLQREVESSKDKYTQTLRRNHQRLSTVAH